MNLPFLNKYVLIISLLVWFTACQSTVPKIDSGNTSSLASLVNSQAKGEWSLADLTANKNMDLSQLRYRISLRITRNEFSLYGPCVQLLGHYHSDNKHLQFSSIETRPLDCINTDDQRLLRTTLQQTWQFQIDEDRMIWRDRQGHILALWQRIYL